jgi:hypothetical protein
VSVKNDNYLEKGKEGERIGLRGNENNFETNLDEN